MAVASELRSRYVMAGRVRTHYTESGDNGPPLILCHGEDLVSQVNLVLVG
jgi:hypothetical protein